MIALLTACFCARVKLHQQKRAKTVFGHLKRLRKQDISAGSFKGKCKIADIVLNILSCNPDNGESENALRFKHHRGKAKHKIHHHDNTEALVSNIAQNVANGLAKEVTEPTTNNTSLSPATPEPSVQPGNATEMLPAPTTSAATSNPASSAQPSSTEVVPVASSPSSNSNAGVSSQTVLPSPTPSSQPQATSSGGIASTTATGVVPAATSLPSPSPSAGAPVVPIASVVPSVSGQTTPVLGTSVAVAPTATQGAPQPGQVKGKELLKNMLFSRS